MLFADARPNRQPTLTEAAALGFTSSLGPLAVNAYVPGFHLMAAEFHTDLIGITQSLTLNLLAFAFATLIVGALSDTFGRRRTIIAGMLVFAAASVGAILAESLATLCVWRILQGFGASVGQVVTQAMVRDRFSGRTAAQMNGLILMFFAVSPAVAPVIGGALIMAFSWHAVFIFLCTYALLIAGFMTFFVAETLPPEARQAFRPAPLLSGYRRTITHKAFMAGVVANGFCFMGGILYSAGAADYVITIMGLGVDDFALFTIPTTVATLLGSWASGRWVAKANPRTLIYASAAAATVLSLLVTTVDFLWAPGFPWLLIGPCLFWFASSVSRPIMMAMNLDYFPKNRGLAASVQQFFVTGSFAFCAAVWIPLVLGVAWRYSLVTTLCGVMMLVLWAFSMSRRDTALKAVGLHDTV